MEQELALAVPGGFQAAGVKAGIKPSGALDLALLLADKPCAAAGTFTTNQVAAAPVQWDREHVPSAEVRAIVVNAGNANAATGREGYANVRRTAEAAAARLGCLPEQVLVASTGVIGHPLPMDRLLGGLDRAFEAIGSEPARFHDASKAILTTDTRPKVVSLARTLSSGTVHLLGMAKGAAMIGPRMATMLAFLLTDANVAVESLQPILADAVEQSFNCISVEGHTSTNDTVLLLASGASAREPLAGADLEAFAGLVRGACQDLARRIPQDGEGAAHLITIDVEGCRDRRQARTIAAAVADSPLVKTAIAGGDPNWGRIVSAAGYAGVPFDPSEVSLWLNGVLLFQCGSPAPFDAAKLSAGLKTGRDVSLRLAFALGTASVRFWTCDLTAEYVRLNADYTT